MASCSNKKNKRIRTEDFFAEGEISQDTIYNGLIRFYDTATNHLVTTANYKAGILEGNLQDYYINGNIKIQSYYQNGKTNGQVKFFDSSGAISCTQNMYFDLRVGPTIEYKNGIVNQYYFYSLENKELLHIDYDSVEGKGIEEITDTTLFFWHSYDYSTSDSKETKTDLFIYLPNPPGCNFQYSICVVNREYEIKEIVKEFKPYQHFDKIYLDYSSLKTDETFAIKLTVDNKFDKDDRMATMFKRL
jgi:hypothetical protein